MNKILLYLNYITYIISCIIPKKKKRPAIRDAFTIRVQQAAAWKEIPPR